MNSLMDNLETVLLLLAVVVLICFALTINSKMELSKENKLLKDNMRRLNRNLEDKDTRLKKAYTELSSITPVTESSKIKNQEIYDNLQRANVEVGLLSHLISMACYGMSLHFAAYANGRVYSTFTYTRQHGVKVKEKRGARYITVSAVLGIVTSDNYFISFDDLGASIDAYRDKIVIENLASTETIDFNFVFKGKQQLVNIDTLLQ